ncbi:MAG: hypothetical protein IT581_12890 [Verrucomicrobiales bacterium]|nr:hypothetical protein [Verrucomicrobiales bacterium]
MTPIRLTLFCAALWALEPTASAQVNLYLAGAVSLKDVVYKTITGLYGPNLTSINADNAAKPQNANKLTLTGQMAGLFGNQTVTVFINYNGSGPAIQSLTQNTPISFFATATQGNTNPVTMPIDVGFSVVFQRDFPYPTPVLHDEVYGVTPTIFVKSPDAPASFTNLTSQQYRLLSGNGAIPQFVLTGNTNDTGTIYWIMRDIGAAHRVISAKEAGFSGSALAYAYKGGNWVIDPTGQTTWPAILNLVTNSFGPCVTFVPPPEAGSVPPQNILSFNGQLPFRGTYSTVSNDFTPVITGQYTCWGFEHIMTRPNAAATVSAFASALKESVQTNMVTSPYSIPLSRMQVTRNATGGVVTPQ